MESGVRNREREKSFTGKTFFSFQFLFLLLLTTKRQKLLFAGERNTPICFSSPSSGRKIYSRSRIHAHDEKMSTHLHNFFFFFWERESGIFSLCSLSLFHILSLSLCVFTKKGWWFFFPPFFAVWNVRRQWENEVEKYKAKISIQFRLLLVRAISLFFHHAIACSRTVLNAPFYSSKRVEC